MTETREVRRNRQSFQGELKQQLQLYDDFNMRTRYVSGEEIVKIKEIIKSIKDLIKILDKTYKEE